MQYDQLKTDVRDANLAIVDHGLVELTWGNVSAVLDDVMAIKPSGVPYDKLEPDDIVVLSISTGEVVEGRLRPSSDTPTHLHLYRSFSGIGAIVHTHSRHAVCWAQAGREIECMGTTHADNFNGTIPVTRRMRSVEIAHEYEKNTGVVIVERFAEGGIDPDEIPAVLVAGHGPFAWGRDVHAAVQNAVVLESVAYMAIQTLALDPNAGAISQELLDKHYLRKHGSAGYYGQR